jgi:ATPase family associated with various cellular activities (AAA)
MALGSLISRWWWPTWLRSADDIDVRIARTLGRRRLPHCHVHVKDLPGYRFVDLHRATDAFCRARGVPVVIESVHASETLSGILHSAPGRYVSRRITRAARAPWATGPGEEVFLPADCFWLSRADGDDATWLVLRVEHQKLPDRAVLEVAAEDPAAAQAAVESIVAASARGSIYRNRVLAINLEAGIKDEYGDVERPDRLRVLFRREEAVGDDDIVIDDEVRAVLWRNVVDLHRRRTLLRAHGVPLRRGVLLYGPPGTGKTFACRYLCGKLPETTRIIAAGTALLQVQSVFNLARLLQPSLVILEDVDLIFAAREITLYGSVLGELLDQMDGLRPFEEIGVILTTNAIERLEAAIKDRPGRISQCVYLGPPPDTLRSRYLRRYLHPYDIGALDLDTLVGASHGATQAFLKEWVHRSVQVAAERLADAVQPLQLRNGDFDTALREMRRFSSGSTGRIIGFHDAHGRSSAEHD